MKSRYDRQPIPISKQIALFKDSGMIFSDYHTALKILSIIGCYRFSGYAYPFLETKDRGSFAKGTSFEKIYSIYEFDRKLKALLFTNLARIEIALRTLIIEKFSLGKTTAIWYANPNYFNNREEHASFLNNILANIQNSNEDFINHFRERYNDEFPPSWIALQITSFGALVKLYRNFNDKALQEQVSKTFGCDRVERFISWMNTLVYIRNICSHHARLWNRRIRKRPEAYNFGIRTKRWNQQETSTVYYSICVIGYLLKNILPGNSFKSDLSDLFSTNYYVNSTKFRFLGFPKNWQSELFW